MWKDQKWKNWSKQNHCKSIWKVADNWVISYTFQLGPVSARSSRPEVFCKKGVLGNLIIFTGKDLYQSLFFNKVAGLSLFFNKVASLRPAALLKKRLWHRCFPVNKFLRKPFLQNTSGGCFWSAFRITKRLSHMCFMWILQKFENSSASSKGNLTWMHEENMYRCFFQSVTKWAKGVFVIPKVYCEKIRYWEFYIEKNTTVGDVSNC